VTASGGETVGSQLQHSLDLLHQLYLDVEALGDDLEDRGRIRQTVQALRRQPNLHGLPRTLLRVQSELAHALSSIRVTRETIQSYSIERLRDTHARLSEVSTTSETAAMEMLNGLDRTLAMIDQLERDGIARRPREMCEALRNEVNQLYGCLQFQDIIAQQLRGVGALLVEVEQRVEGIASLFDGTLAGDTPARAESPDPDSYNPNASMRDAGQRQALIDEAFRTARPAPGATLPAAAR
jgi:hypothetical protein